MLKVEYTTQFKRDVKLASKRRKNMDALKNIMRKIERKKFELAIKRLFINWKLEILSIEPDWLLIYMCDS